MRYSLRRMLGAVTAVAIVLTALMYLTANYRKQLAIRSHLQTAGAYLGQNDASRHHSVA